MIKGSVQRALPFLATGLGIRLLFLFLASDIEPHADESNYIYLALCLNRFSILIDCYNFLWPPGYPAYLAFFLDRFGVDGIFAAKLVQVALSGVVGLSIYLFGLQIYHPRAARTAGWIWAFYLPLVGFTHYLWPETIFLALFLPGLLLLIKALGHETTTGKTDRLLLLAGLLLGFSLYFKEVALYLILLLSCLIFLKVRGSLSNRGRPAVTFLLAAIVAILPWTLRNYEVYKQVAPVGATLGVNLYLGMNSKYKNLDYPTSLRTDAAEANGRVRDLLVGDAPAGWDRAQMGNVVERSRKSTATALRFARENLPFVLRSRVKQIADFVSPVSFFVRHFALEKYGGILSAPVVTRSLVYLAVLMTISVTALSTAGFFRIPSHPTRMVLAVVIVYFLAVIAPLGGLSRYRIPIEPLLILLAGGALSRATISNSLPPVRWGPVAAILAALLLLWAINAAEVVSYLSRIG